MEKERVGCEEVLLEYAMKSYVAMGAATYVSCRCITAPYGKHERKGWGPGLPPSLAWFVMESPTLWLTLLVFPVGRHSSHPKSLLLISPFILHYLHRTIIYPLRLIRQRTRTSAYPLALALIAFSYNLFNTYLQARWLSHYADYHHHDGDFFWYTRFCGGLLLFSAGMFINVTSDVQLLKLKARGRGYQIPTGGLFEYVSCANYFGEILEWFAWAFMTRSWPAFAFFLYTCANLVPRARANHNWYLRKFGERYPKGRKAVIPFLY